MTYTGNPENEQDRSCVLDAQDKISTALACLQDARTQASALMNLKEIAALMGSEEIAIFKIDEPKTVFWLYWSTGIDPNRYVCLEVACQAKLAAVLLGRTMFAEKRNEKLLNVRDPVSALIPVVAQGAVAGVIVIFRLRPEKTALSAADRDICRALSTCAIRAIQPITANYNVIESKNR
jgi:hypothetical protein